MKFCERLGLRRIGSSLNRGPEQDKLDGVAEALVAVTALAPSTPHVELLCYRSRFAREPVLPSPNDTPATRLALAVETSEILEALCAHCPGALLSDPVRFENGALRAMLRDPDGHLLCLEVLQ